MKKYWKGPIKSRKAASFPVKQLSESKKEGKQQTLPGKQEEANSGIEGYCSADDEHSDNDHSDNDIVLRAESEQESDVWSIRTDSDAEEPLVSGGERDNVGQTK